jgi:hypothetical protein
MPNEEDTLRPRPLGLRLIPVAAVTDFDSASPRNEGEPDVERRRSLSAFLTRHRSRIDPALPVLGEHHRRVGAIGNPVTPREIADAAEINRRWYEFAERGEPTRASAAVLRALGNVLGLSAQERAVLVNLATPYLDRDTPREESLDVRDALGSLRGYLRKLYACSTKDEVLSLVAETAASLFAEASYIATYSRQPDRGWSHHGELIGTGKRLHAFSYNRDEVVAPIFASDPLAADVITCFPELSLPGDLLTYDHYKETRVVAALGKGFRVFKQVHEASLAGVIRSRAGFVAQLLLGDFREIYDDEVDRALVSAIVDFASLTSSP